MKIWCHCWFPACADHVTGTLELAQGQGVRAALPSERTGLTAASASLGNRANLRHSGNQAKHLRLPDRKISILVWLDYTLHIELQIIIRVTDWLTGAGTFCLLQMSAEDRKKMLTFIPQEITWNFRLLVAFNQATNGIEYLACWNYFL